MPTIRRERQTPYFSCSREMPQDLDLSFEAVGLLSYLFSKPDNWTVQFEDVERRGNLGRDKRRRLFAEIEKAGYFERRRIRNPKTQQWDYELIVHEIPLSLEKRTSLSAKPITEKPSTAEPSPEKPSTAQPSTAGQAIIDNRESHIRELDNKELVKKENNISPLRGGAASPPVNPVVASPKKKPEKPKDPRADHWAIQGIRSFTQRYPMKFLWDDIIQDTGTQPQMDKLKAVLKEWVKRGYNPGNTLGYLEWFKSGIPAVKEKMERLPTQAEMNRAAPGKFVM